MAGWSVVPFITPIPGWFFGPILTKIINACFEYLQDQSIWQTGMKEKLERLRRNHDRVQAIVPASNQTQIRDQSPGFNRWIWQLRDAFDEAVDVLDDFEYEKLREETWQKVPSTTSSLNKIGKRALKKDPNLKRLEAVVKKLDEVSAEVTTFLHLLENAKQEQQELDLQLSKDRETGPLPTTRVIGRDEDKDSILEWLGKPTYNVRPTLYENISLLSIMGHGGMGKTALLQDIYDDPKEKFQLKMWVCVSNHFDAKKIIADMLGFLNKERPRSESLAAFQKSLRAVVHSKKFLLVLDDIWEEDASKWENVLSPLAYGGLGSKILLTTRMDSVASAIAKVMGKFKEFLILTCSNDRDCLYLLKTHAFAGVGNFRAHTNLIDISELMVKKLSGCPLAAKAIGAVLNSNFDESFWKSILNTDNILNVNSESGGNSILPILRLSFTFLPQHLQICFAFFGIFPQGHWFDKDDLVRMWIALGFIHKSSTEGETLEDIGGRYFDALVSKSFLEEFDFKKTIKKMHGKIQHTNKCYKMHDLIHALARYFSSEECFRFVGDDVLSFKTPKNVRHLFVETENLEVLRMIKHVKNLHSLFITTTTNDQCFTKILTKIFKASRSIRLLFIDSTDLGMMPKAIKKLRHLRYFNLSGHLTQMPRSLSRLYHLRFIIYKDRFGRSCSDDFLPEDVRNLSNLRHLELPGYVSVSGTGKLRPLEELNEFNVKNENGYSRPSHP